jgi:hypothetical protein
MRGAAVQADTVSEIIDISVPSRDWKPRPHQQALWDYMMTGGKRSVAVWHRRAGKDEVCMNATAVAMLERPGNYWHCLPTFTSARKAIWTAVNPHTGRRRIDEAFPREMRAATNDHEMFVRFHNGSTWQIIGSDSVVSGGGIGSSTAGIVFSEWALSNPSAWAYYRPMLEENNGWASFIFTPRGRNHALALYQHAARTKGWFSEILTAEDTGALSAEELAEALNEYETLYGADAGRAMFDQEMLCSFNAAILGAFYAHECKQVRDEGRIRDDVEALPERAVNWAWDIGVGDDTSLWAYQAQGAQLVILDHYAASGVGVEHYAGVVEQKEREHGWTHGVDYVPHDAKVREWGTGRTRVETMRSFGLNPSVVPLASKDDGINAVRRMLPLCVFHTRCDETGIAALEQYRREWDDDKKAFRANEVHDWTCHPADAFRYLAMAYKPAPRREIKLPPQVGFRIPPPPEVRRGGIIL